MLGLPMQDIFFDHLLWSIYQFFNVIASGSLYSSTYNKTSHKQEEKKLTVGTWNIRRGVLKRESEIIELLKQEKFDILFLTETDIIINDEEDLKINSLCE